MPHLILEHSNTLTAHIHIPSALESLENIVCQHPTFTREDLKVRSIAFTPVETTRIAGNPNKPFAHLRFELLNTRPLPVLQAVGKALFAEMTTLFHGIDKNIPISFEIRQMDKDLYWK